MGLYSGYQVVPRYFSDIYTAIYDHVNVQDFHGLPGPERLRSHPVQRREAVVRRLYNRLLPPGRHTYQRLVEFSWRMRLARRLPARTKINIRVDPNAAEPAESPSLRFLLLLLLFSYRLGDATLNIRLRISICSLMVRLGRGLDTVHIQIFCQHGFRSTNLRSDLERGLGDRGCSCGCGCDRDSGGSGSGILSSLTIFTVIVFSPVKEVRP